MKQFNIAIILKSILIIGVLCLYFVPANGYTQGSGESVDLGDEGFNPITDDITKKIPSLEMLIDSAIFNSHRLRFWDKEVAISAYELRSAKREWTNYFYVTGEFKDGNTQSLVFIEDQLGNSVGTLGNTDLTRYSFGVMVRMPVYRMWNHNNKTKIAKMQIESNMEKQLEDKKIIRAEVINLYNELVIQQNMLKLDIDNIDFSTLTAEMAKKQFQDGEITLVDMSRVQDNLARARYRYVRTKLGFVNAYVMLQEITGIKFAELNNWK